ncbi:hypothetical protein NDU88_011687 [Pleurodeles waltl]|uniref:Uncharacterized protein n=1 Tax=Pleurodeles waltl TaxID=8319 RepID=A0AAV7R449_PLEWA|nr:hypothetical protein NDU88_011687 [Pleurodeles waltl]
MIRVPGPPCNMPVARTTRKAHPQGLTAFVRSAGVSSCAHADRRPEAPDRGAMRLSCSPFGGLPFCPRCPVVRS